MSELIDKEELYTRSAITGLTMMFNGSIVEMSKFGDIEHDRAIELNLTALKTLVSRIESDLFDAGEEITDN